jgi:Transposase C of IS166 homeodomain
MILAERAARVEAEAVAARAQAMSSSTDALIAHLKLEIEKLRRALFGSRSERKARLLEQMELALEELEAAATEDGLACCVGCFWHSRISSRIWLETNGLTSSFSFLLCHPNAEAAQLVIVDELDTGVFECRLNFDQS